MQNFTEISQLPPSVKFFSHGSPLPEIHYFTSRNTPTELASIELQSTTTRTVNQAVDLQFTLRQQDLLRKFNAPLRVAAKRARGS